MASTFRITQIGDPQRSARSRPLAWLQALLLGSLLALAGLSPVQARETQASQSSPAQATQAGELAVVALANLPAPAREVHALVLAGGPFPHAKDGSVFGNRERLLPRKPRGHYREYTVRTPGARNRGARRLVCGGTPPTRPEVCYYTDDHYASFRRVAT